MPDRYYSAEPIRGPSVTLAGSEAHHLLHVMRAQPGLTLVVFDGQGGEYEAEVVRCERSTVELQVGPHLAIERELPVAITLAVALPKGDRVRWLIEKAVELGVRRLVPLQTERSVARREKSEKLERYVIEASKQCGRNRLLEIAKPEPWSTLIEAAPDACRLVAHPGGKSLTETDVAVATDVLLAVGPEGGLTDAEITAATEHGWQSVGLGQRILRIETAALALIASIATLRGEST